jgi:ABC-type sugar transport system substrate-binding protein
MIRRTVRAATLLAALLLTLTAAPAAHADTHRGKTISIGCGPYTATLGRTALCVDLPATV